MELLFSEIYYSVFSKIKNGNVDLFLCGGASTKKKKSYRDMFNEELKKYNRISVLYPEDLFLEILNRKKYDLLTLEKFLADNSDFILIVCESPGSFTELGAFVNNNATVDKVIILLQTKYKNAKSFIRQGPVQYIYSKNKERVIYYNSDISDAISRIKKLVLPRARISSFVSFKDLDTITGQYNFILLLLYFYNTLPIKILNENIKSLYFEKGFSSEHFNMFYTSAIRRLFKDGLLTKLSEKNTSCYRLTDKGFLIAKRLLSYADIEKKARLYNRIRLEIINNGG